VLPTAPYQCVEGSYDIQYQRKGSVDHVGSGSTGEVRACTHAGTKEMRCVKSIEKVSWLTRMHVMEEISVLKAVSGKHPNIVRYIEFFEEWGTISLIFEFCPKGNLDQAIQSSMLRSGGERLASNLLHQITSALAFLPEMKIVHRDVKPANLVFSDGMTLKLTDFGSACFASAPLQECQGSPAFYAPEQSNLHRGKGYSFPVDMWALGISFYMLLFDGVHPFQSETAGQMHRNNYRSGEFQVGWLTSRGASDLLEWLLMPNPDQRIGPSDAVNHAWFSSYGYGNGSFTKSRPTKLALDSHGNWRPTY